MRSESRVAWELEGVAFGGLAGEVGGLRVDFAGSGGGGFERREGVSVWAEDEAEFPGVGGGGDGVCGTSGVRVPEGDDVLGVGDEAEVPAEPGGFAVCVPVGGVDGDGDADVEGGDRGGAVHAGGSPVDEAE